MKLATSFSMFVAAVFFGFSAHASVIESADVNGLATFQDTSTGRVWLDINNFYDVTATYGTSGNDMIAVASAAGFTFATEADVRGLLDTLPLESGQWGSYAEVMGYAVPRQLIWGMYEDGSGNPYGYAWAFDYDNAWQFLNNATDANLIQNAMSPGSIDLGIWAYREATVVPVPAAAWLMGSGLLGLVGIARRK